MNTHHVDKLIKSAAKVRITDTAGDTGVVSLMRRERSKVYCVGGELFHLSDIVSFEELQS